MPEIVNQHLKTAASMSHDELESLSSELFDIETVAQAYCYITVGACFSIAFKFAGSANAQAFDVLV